MAPIVTSSAGVRALYPVESVNTSCAIFIYLAGKQAKPRSAASITIAPPDGGPQPALRNRHNRYSLPSHRTDKPPAFSINADAVYAAGREQGVYTARISLARRRKDFRLTHGGSLIRCVKAARLFYNKLNIVKHQAACNCSNLISSIKVLHLKHYALQRIFMERE